MSFLSGILGGVVGAELQQVVGHVIQQHGGLSGLVQQFERSGLGGVVQSWVGKGANLPISSEQLHQALGSNAVTELAAKFGISPGDLASKLSQILPAAVDHMTPDGVVPSA